MNVRVTCHTVATLRNPVDCKPITLDLIIDQYADVLPEAISILEDGLEDSLRFYSFPEIDARKIASTNTLERLNVKSEEICPHPHSGRITSDVTLNKEIRRRSKVIGVFPSVSS